MTKVVTRVIDQGSKLELYFDAATNVMIDKSSIKLRVTGNVVYLYDNSMSDSVIQYGTQRVYSLDYTVITAPVAASAILLETAILVMLNTGSSTIIPVPPSIAANTWSDISSFGYRNSLIVKASPGILNGFTGFNSGPAQWIQLHNTIAVPSDGDIPYVILYAAANSNFYWDVDDYGKWFSTGITICNSSTGPTKTIGLNDCWFNAFYK